ncbi:Uncharacterized protein TCM_034852 [Theobroma cacao]|uniref:Uncharacterized protein n=1 Tax=Theobroma cacao TaxID=3641 RepID=A0A061FF20_THECC|nr:Uncharacterized protein TCM_034852 [Theobroma cacao]
MISSFFINFTLNFCNAHRLCPNGMILSFHLFFFALAAWGEDGFCFPTLYYNILISPHFQVELWAAKKLFFV